MRSSSIWSLNVGRVAGVQIRLHGFFFLFAVLTIYFSTQLAPAMPSMAFYGGASLLILLASVVLHELGHCYAAMRLDGQIDEIVLGPLGGLAPIHFPSHPPHHLIGAVAGPAANMMVLVVLLPVMVWRQDVSVLGLLHPLAPIGMLNGPAWLDGLRLTFWINWMLVLVNLIPADPFDGARILRSLLWPALGYRRAVLAAATVAKVTAVVFCLAAWYVSRPGSIEGPKPVPLWMPLVLLAIVLFFSAKIEVEKLREQELGEQQWLGYDFSEGYTSLERSHEPEPEREPGPLGRWIRRRQQVRAHRRRIAEEEEEWRVDDILARLHRHGIESLSSKDRALLHRVSARYRERT